MKSTLVLPDPYGCETYGSGWRPIGERLRIKRERQKLPPGYVMLRTGITTQRLEAIERGAVTPTTSEVEKIERVEFPTVTKG